MHSSGAEASIESVPPPNREEIPPEDPPGRSSAFKRPSRRILIAAVITLAVGALLVAAASKKHSLTTTATHSSLAHTDLSQALRLKGTTEAVQSRSILAPALAGQQVSTLTITKLALSGAHVKRGDLLVEFDRQVQIRDFMDKRAEYSKLVDQVLEEQAKENAARAKDETEMKQAEGELGKAELEMQKVETLSRIDAEKAQERLEEAKATLQQRRETFDLKRKAAQAAIHILEIQRDRSRETMLHAQANADLMLIRSPIDGVVVLNTIWKEGRMGEVKEGDHLRPGVPFMQVVDPSVMQVRVLANQQDFLGLHIGQPARVHLDAYPELVFSGKVEEMAPIGRSGDFSSTLRTFTVIFSLAGNDAKLMPDLSAAVDVDLAARGEPVGGSR
jgi:multidrug efflux pump subunit AcrA (membrane-fusion protein)